MGYQRNQATHENDKHCNTNYVKTKHNRQSGHIAKLNSS